MAESSPPAVADPMFVGREWALARVDGWLGGAEQTLLITGGPGAGKSALASRVEAISTKRVPPVGEALRKGAIAVSHTCRALDPSRIDPLRFVERVSAAIAELHEPYANAVRNLGDQRIDVRGTLMADHIGPGADVAGVRMTVRIAEMSAGLAFERVIRGPLSETGGSTPPLVVLVDALDEALTLHADENIVDLIADALSAESLPAGLRFLMTTRPDPRVLDRFLSSAMFDLIKDAPVPAPIEGKKSGTLDDIGRYASERLSTTCASDLDETTSRIAAAAAGNFLYARYVIDDAIARDDFELTATRLPAGLDDWYRQYLQRELTRNDERWEDRYRPLLGLLSVAVGAGVVRQHLVGASQLAPSRVDDALRALRQYITAPSEEGPFQLYHESFREFLTFTKPFPVYPVEAHAALGLYLYRRYAHVWAACDDDYALLNTLDHLTHASITDDLSLDPNTRSSVASARAQLVADPNYAASTAELRWIREHTRGFINREYDLRQVDHWLTAGETPSLLIVGPPGSAKTILAARIVELARSSHRSSTCPALSSGVFSLVLRASPVERSGESRSLNRLTERVAARLRSISGGHGYAPHSLPSDFDDWDRLCEMLSHIRASERAETLLLVDGLDEFERPQELGARLSLMAERGAFRLIVTTRAFAGIEMLRRAATTITPAMRIGAEGVGNIWPLMALLAEADRRGEPPAEIGNRLSGIISNYICGQLRRAGEDKALVRKVLQELRAHEEGLTPTELAARCGVEGFDIERVVDYVSSLVADTGDGRFRLCHQAIGDVLDSIRWMDGRE